MENDKLNYKDDITGKKPTKKQLEVLLLLNPFKGYKTENDIAKELGISRIAVCNRMQNLKKRCPSIYKKFMKLKEPICPIIISDLCRDDEQNECFDYLKIKEIF